MIIVYSMIIVYLKSLRFSVRLIITDKKIAKLF